VAQWLDENGDPRTGPVDMVDWIELIPVGETRNYVQRVTENVTMYRAGRNDSAPILTNTPWTR
jgi:soluble lytic murein transglycosylase